MPYTRAVITSAEIATLKASHRMKNGHATAHD
jgi:hypothetical protein